MLIKKVLVILNIFGCFQLNFEVVEVFGKRGRLEFIVDNILCWRQKKFSDGREFVGSFKVIVLQKSSISEGCFGILREGCRLEVRLSEKGQFIYNVQKYIKVVKMVVVLMQWLYLQNYCLRE